LLRDINFSNKKMQYREANKSDINTIAQIRANEWGTAEYWNTRISGYMDCTHHPQQALMPRIIYLAIENETIVGFIAGHLTKRYECDGELEWIDVIREYRRNGIASELVRLLAKWFIEQNAFKICIDPGNITARQFYAKNGAEPLNEHWMVWKDINVVLAKQ
jgi:GNAT superfamily N-acetyltransferase